ncbi:MAG: zf-HC2 domain-containing protein [candidate division WOR-3 bacterium]|nr:MAG: zf-HC2 domain-containing protein [candidate division WOR-3 bacterium]
MKCHWVQKKISAYLDSELPEEEMKCVWEHLEHCGECKAELAALYGVVDILRTLEGMDVPPYFIVRLKGQIRDSVRPLPLLQRIRGIVVSTATAVAVVASLFMGNQIGRALFRSIAQTGESTVSETSSVLGLDTFEEFPDNSLSDIYDELVSGGNNNG